MHLKTPTTEQIIPTPEVESLIEGQLQRVNEVLDSVDLPDNQVLRVAQSVNSYARGQSFVKQEDESPILRQLSEQIEQVQAAADTARTEHGIRLEETMREALKLMPESETGYEDLVSQTELARRMTEYSALKEMLNGDMRSYVLDLCGITEDDPLAKLIPRVNVGSQSNEGAQTGFDVGYDTDDDSSYVAGDVSSGVMMVMGGKCLDAFYESFQSAAQGSEIVDKKLIRRLALVYVAGHEMGHVITEFVGQGFWPDTEDISYNSTSSMAYLMKHPEEAMSYHAGEAEIIEEERFAEGIGQQIATRFAAQWASENASTRNNFNEHWSQVIGSRTEAILASTRKSDYFWRIHHIADSETDDRPISGKGEDGQAVERRRQAQQIGYATALTLPELQQRLGQLKLYAEDPEQVEHDRAQLRIMTGKNAEIPWAQYIHDFGGNAPRRLVARAARGELLNGQLHLLSPEEVATLGAYVGTKKVKAGRKIREASSRLNKIAS